ncbi:S-layer family protein [Aneurinibacillus soli]|uniref:Endo-1,4-beta-xylanase A n=1 Tax=Aneurinibacillus soli TaxID=1500254 RepID=A0A0U4WLH7_9BACL|nr:S-layer homology domain-containing protein [Aneurinibacillus soli]PYE57244.1 S-layer family protein [Aneurinibacillus soli]BAU29240.1 Endo-1,4-beta-xylanase A precursor [Aneurinibacillus soli]
MNRIFLRSLLSCLLTVSLFAGHAPQSASAAAAFHDINDHWAKGQIRSLAQQGIVTGINSDTYAPDRPLTRSEFVVMLARVFKSDLKTKGSAYEVKKYYRDVDVSDFYADELVRLNRAGIIDDRGSFYGDRYITRQEMAHYLVNAYNYLYGQNLSTFVNANQSSFTDSSKISPRYRDDVVIADKIHLITGRDGGKFAPRDTLTRGEAASVIYRFSQLIPYEDKGVRSGPSLANINDAYYKNGKLYITFTYSLSGAGYNGQIIVITRSGKQVKIDVEPVKLDGSSSTGHFKQTRTITIEESGVQTIFVRMNGKETARFNV